MDKRFANLAVVNSQTTMQIVNQNQFLPQTAMYSWPSFSSFQFFLNHTLKSILLRYRNHGYHKFCMLMGMLQRYYVPALDLLTHGRMHLSSRKKYVLIPVGNQTNNQLFFLDVN